MKKVTKKWLINKLDKLGYKIEDESSFNYTNNLNKVKYKARSCYIIEKDSGLSFANIKAKRDKNFIALQKFRMEDYLINNRLYEL